MALIQRVPGVTFTNTLPKLYRDQVINAGTLQLYDALDTFSWPSQAAGPGTLNNLVDGGASAAVSSTVLFDNGFRFVDTGSGADLITLPASAQPTATEPGFLFLLWLKRDATQVNTMTAAVAGASTSNTNGYRITSASNGAIGLGFCNPETFYNTVADQVYQFAISAKRRVDNSGYDFSFWQDGGLLLTSFRAGDFVPAGTPRIGALGGTYQTNWKGVVFRSMFDSLSAKTAQEIVELDYEKNVGRFV